MTTTGNPDILAGDFNIHHSSWDPKARSDSVEGDSLLSWTASKGLRLLNQQGTPTHDAGAALDLCFARNSVSASCEIRQDLEVGSDHRTILCQIFDWEAEKPVPGKL